MKITNEKTENRQVYLTIELEPAELEEGMGKAYNRLVKKYNVPGFRKGKTPRPILEQFIGRAAFIEDAVEHMAPEVFEKAAKEQDLKPVARPEVSLDKIDPVTYKMVVPLEPVIKLGDYHQINMTQESVQLKEEDINKAIEQLRRQHAIWDPVERQVNSRDLVIMDIESKVGEQPFINQKDAEYEVDKESVFPLKGFAEEIIGIKKGETKEFNLKFPDDYGRAELAGKEVQFKVTMKEIKQQRLPDFNDDLAKQVNPELKTAEELKTKITEGMKKAAEENAKKEFEQKIIDAVVGQAEIEYPNVMIEEEIDNLIRDQMRRWQMDAQGMDEYLKSIQRTPEQLREELRPAADKTLKQSLVLMEVAKKENIQISQEDIKTNIETMTKDVTPDKKDSILQFLTLPQSQISLASSIATRRTIEKLTEIVSSPSDNVEKNENKEAMENTEDKEKAEKEEITEEPEAKKGEAAKEEG